MLYYPTVNDDCAPATEATSSKAQANKVRFNIYFIALVIATSKSAVKVRISEQKHNKPNDYFSRQIQFLQGAHPS